MKYILSTDWEEGIADLTARLIRELASGHRVLWLLCGGSNIPASVAVMENISAEQSQKLTLGLTDERYGEPGHADSNWQQLHQAGFDAKQAVVLPVLQSGSDLATTAEHYHQTMEQAFVEHNVVIAQFGIGPDGHIAGILPGSSAAQADNSLVVGYDAPPFQRLTLTFAGLRQVKAAYAFAFGEPKHAALADLQTKNLPLIEQPAQILKELPEAYLYSDQVGEPA